ncbi:hypothetical protein LJC33_02370 [Eubacteriales bacterium OttesenSCG-928-N13]|nr:hypothetical protein [Eubacteriales bacterium OttesenSCG-928-N13]
MPNTKITREALKNHYQYGKWFYVLIIICACIVGSLLFDTTAYRSPPEKKVTIQLVGYYCNVEPVQQIADTLMEHAADVDPELEQIEIFNLMYNGDAMTDTNGAQNYQVQLVAGDGDVFVVSREMLQTLAMMEGAVPLDSYIESGLLDVEGLDLELGSFYDSELVRDEDDVASYSLEEEEPVPAVEVPKTGEKHVYGLPITDLLRLAQPDIGYPVEDKYIALLVRSTNQDTTMKIIQQLRELLRDTIEMPELYEKQAEEQAQTEQYQQQLDALMGEDQADGTAQQPAEGETE